MIISHVGPPHLQRVSPSLSKSLGQTVLPSLPILDPQTRTCCAQCACTLECGHPMQVLGLAWCGVQDSGAVAIGTMLKSNNVSSTTKNCFWTPSPTC